MNAKILSRLGIIAATGAAALLLSGCDGVFLGLGGNVDVPTPIGSVNVGVGTTVPVYTPPVGWGIPGYHHPWMGRPTLGPMGPTRPRY